MSHTCYNNGDPTEAKICQDFANEEHEIRWTPVIVFHFYFLFQFNYIIFFFFLILHFK